MGSAHVWNAHHSIARADVGSMPPCGDHRSSPCGERFKPFIAGSSTTEEVAGFTVLCGRPVPSARTAASRFSVAWPRPGVVVVNPSERVRAVVRRLQDEADRISPPLPDGTRTNRLIHSGIETFYASPPFMYMALRPAGGDEDARAEWPLARGLFDAGNRHSAVIDELTGPPSRVHRL